MPLYHSGRPDIQAKYFIGGTKPKVIDLSPYITGINVSKDLSQSAGMWEISLVTDFIQRGVLNADELTPFDYMEMQVRSDPGLARPFYYTRGFVDNISLATDGAPTGGRMQRQITLNGRDYGGLLQDYKVYAVNARQLQQQKAFSLLTDQLGFSSNSKKKQSYSLNISDFVSKVIHNILDDIHINRIHSDQSHTPALRTLQKYMRNVDILANMPSRFGVQLTQNNLIGFSGSLDDLIRQVQSPPWGEYFIRDDPDVPRVYFRVPPFLAEDGMFADHGGKSDWIKLNYIQPYNTASELMWVELLPQDIMSTNLTKSQNQVYTYFISGIQAGVFSGDIIGAILAENTGIRSTNTNPYLAGDDVGNPKALNRAARFGFRPLETQSTLIAGTTGNTGFTAIEDKSKDQDGGVKLMEQMNQWVVRSFNRNEELESGTIVCRGIMGTRRGYNEIAARVGDYVYLQKERGDQPFYYYIQAMDVSWSEGSPLTTTFQVVRGEKFEKGLKEHPYKLYY